MRRAIPCLASAAAVLAASWFGFFFFRDNFSTHWPIKALSAAAFRSGSIPWWNFSAGGGQPLAGNPNTLTFYPDNILYLFLPAHVAFNLHFWLHLALAFAAMRGLALELGTERRMATLTGAIYTLSGVVISAAAFYNMTAAAALVPLAFLCGERLLRRRSIPDSLALGGACGLLALAGEPVQVAGAGLGLLILVLLRPRTDGPEKPRGSLAAPLGLSLITAIAVAAPLLLSWQEIASEVERGAFRYSAQTVLAASLPPYRLLEILVGPFHGLIGDAGPSAYHPPPGGWPPLFGSALIGIVVLPALLSRTAPRRYQWMAAVMAFLALGAFNPIVRTAVESFSSLRIARYPEKLILPMTVAVVALLGLYLQKIPEPASDRTIRFMACAPLLIIGLDFWRRGGRRAAMNAVILVVAALIAYVLARLAPRQRRLVLAMTLVPMAYWAIRIFPLDWFAPYWTAPLGPTVRMAHAMGESIVLPADADDIRAGYRLRYQRRDPLSATASGYRYALERSPDGMYSALSRFVQERFAVSPPPLRLRYARLLGCSVVVGRQATGPGARWVTIGVEQMAVTPVDRPLPEVFAAERIVPASSIQQAVGELESPSFDEQTAVVGPQRLAGLHIGRPTELTSRRRGGAFEIVAGSESSSLIVVNESYFRAWNATARDGTGSILSLPTFPANIDRLAFVVPPGRWTIDVQFGRRRHLVAMAWALSVLVLCAAALAAWRSRSDSASPAR